MESRNLSFTVGSMVLAARKLDQFLFLIFRHSLPLVLNIGRKLLILFVGRPVIIEFSIEMGQAKARPKIWPVGHVFWPNPAHPGHILASPT